MAPEWDPLAPASRQGDVAKSLRVLHVIPSVALSNGGPSKAISQMERVLAESGAEVVTVTTDDNGPHGRLAVATGAAVECNGATRFYFRRQTSLYKASLPMLPWLRREVSKFDVVHVHGLFSFAPVAAAWIARSAGVPYIIRPLGVLNRYGMEQRRSRLKLVSMALLEGGLLRDAAAVHFTAEQERVEAEALGVPMRAVVVPLGIEPIPSTSADIFLSAHPDVGNRRLLYLSRVDRKKNLEGLLRAVEISRRSIPALSLFVCGDGDPAYLATLKNLSIELGLQECVVWAGHVDGEMKASAFAAAEVFVLPSFSENFGISAVEALGAGLPCILGTGVAIAGRIEQAGAGLAVAPTPASVSTAITHLLGDAALLERAGVRARELAAREYSLPAMGRGLARMYATALASGRAQ